MLCHSFVKKRDIFWCQTMGIWVVKLSLNIRKDRQWTVEQIGSWEWLGGRKEGRGELFSGNFGKSSKRPSLRGRRRRQRDKEGRQEPKTRKIFSIHTFLLVWKDKNCISILVKFEYISYNTFQLNFFLNVKLWHIDIITSSSKFVHDSTFQGSF